MTGVSTLEDAIPLLAPAWPRGVASRAFGASVFLGGNGARSMAPSR